MPKPKRTRETYTSTINREVALARERIGTTRIAELKWLLKFAYADLERMSGGQRDDLGWEFVAFSFDAPVAQPVDYAVRFQLEPRVHVHPEDLRRFHESAREGLDSFFSSGWEMTRPEVFERLKVGTRPFAFESPKNYQPRRVRYAFDLVRANCDRLLICSNPKCKKPFVVEKKGRGQFCSPRCSAYVRILRFRTKQKIDAMTPEERAKLVDHYRNLRKQSQ